MAQHAAGRTRIDRFRGTVHRFRPINRQSGHRDSGGRVDQDQIPRGTASVQPPTRDAVALVTVDGIIAIKGSPTLWPPQPQNVRGSGDSATNRVMLVVAPLPGNTMGVTGLAAPH